MHSSLLDTSSTTITPESLSASRERVKENNNILTPPFFAGLNESCRNHNICINNTNIYDGMSAKFHIFYIQNSWAVKGQEIVAQMVQHAKDKLRKDGVDGMKST